MKNMTDKINKLHIDFESRSEVDLKLVGAYKYAQHPSTEILCMSYALNDEPVRCVEYEQSFRDLIPLFNDVRRGKIVMVAFNAFFERCMFKFKMRKFFGSKYDELCNPKYWQCTMAKACVCGLTGSLDVVCQLLGMSEHKDKDGKRIMMKMTKPRKPRKAEKPDLLPGQILWHETPEDFEKLYEYCNQDVNVERGIDKRLPRISDSEQVLWQIDQRINDTGIAVDMPRVNKAIRIMTDQKRKANTKIKYLTEFRVEKITQVAKIKTELVRICEDHRKKECVPFSTYVFPKEFSLDAQHLDDLLAKDTLPQLAKDILELRKNNGKSSTAKYEAIKNMELTGRIFGLFRFHHAAPGRWSSTGVQLHNLPRGNIKDIDTARFAFDYEAFWMYPPIANLLSCLIRSMMIADDGYDFIQADYSAIEARILNWLAGQHNIVQRFKDDEPVYCDMAGIIYNRHITKEHDPDERFVGKQTELGCGYGMGATRFHAQCITYGHEIPMELAEKSVKAYRKSHPKVVKFWYATERMVRNAITNKGQVYHCNGIYAKFTKSFLKIKLLSGRLLYYYEPHFGSENDIRYWGYSSQTHHVCKQYSYGAKFVENIVQATARDILANALKTLEGSKYKAILHVHDEVVSLVKEGEGDIDEYCDLVTNLPAWASGCPTKAEGWIGKYYKKD